jgi:hypothetical protein
MCGNIFRIAVADRQDYIATIPLNDLLSGFRISTKDSQSGYSG